MKKFTVILFCLALVLSSAGCGNAPASGAKIDYGESAVYTEADRQAAAEIIIKEFSSFRGCELHSLSYPSDDACNTADNISWMNQLGEARGAEETFTQCIMFNSSFRSPKKGGGAWAANEEYHWSWWLARSEGGEWNLMTWGY